MVRNDGRPLGEAHPNDDSEQLKRQEEEAPTTAIPPDEFEEQDEDELAAQSSLVSTASRTATRIWGAISGFATTATSVLRHSFDKKARVIADISRSVPANEREAFVTQMNTLVRGREGNAFNLARLVLLLHAIPVDERDEFVTRMNQITRQRDGDLVDLHSFITALRTFNAEERDRVIGAFGRVNLQQATRFMYYIGEANVRGNGATQVHRVAAREMGPIYNKIRNRLEGKSLVSQQDALTHLNTWIEQQNLSDIYPEKDLEKNRQLMRNLLQHNKWSAALGMSFTGLEGNPSGADLLRMVVTDILHTPEGEERNNKIKQLLTQGLMDAITAYVDNNAANLDNASCVAGIAERLILAFRERGTSVNDLAALIQRDPAFSVISNLGAARQAIPPEIMGSLLGLSKEDMKKFLVQKFEKTKNDAMKRLVSNGHDQYIVKQAGDLVSQTFALNDNDIEEIFQQVEAARKQAPQT